MDLGRFDRQALLEYTAAQLANFFPDGAESPLPCFQRHAAETLLRLERCINAVRIWKADRFDYLHSSQYATYLYFLANTIWRNEPESVEVSTRLFLLNKTLNGIDLFYEIAMPEIFLIGHSTGIVLAKATYGNYLVLHQNTTVGKNYGVAPVLGEGVVLYPNSTVIGRSVVADNVAISQGTSVINQTVPGNCMVFGKPRGVSIKASDKRFTEDFFRI